MDRIYATIARAIRDPDRAQKSALLTAVATELIGFDSSHATHLATQAAFDAWFGSAINRAMALPFTWTGAAGGVHAHPTFGAAQRLLNLGLKDWWALSPGGTCPTALVDRLHGPFDQIVYACTSRFAGRISSLHGRAGVLKSYVTCLTPTDYGTYQTQLRDLARRLAGRLGLPHAPCRIELEQLPWGWV